LLKASRVGHGLELLRGHCPGAIQRWLASSAQLNLYHGGRLSGGRESEFGVGVVGAEAVADWQKAAGRSKIVPRSNPMSSKWSPAWSGRPLRVRSRSRSVTLRRGRLHDPGLGGNRSHHGLVHSSGRLPTTRHHGGSQAAWKSEASLKKTVSAFNGAGLADLTYAESPEIKQRDM